MTTDKPAQKHLEIEDKLRSRASENAQLIMDHAPNFTKEGLEDLLYSMVHGIAQYVKAETEQAAEQRGRDEIINKIPSALDLWYIAMQCQKAAEQEAMGDVKLFRIKLLQRLTSKKEGE